MADHVAHAATARTPCHEGVGVECLLQDGRWFDVLLPGSGLEGGGESLRSVRARRAAPRTELRSCFVRHTAIVSLDYPHREYASRRAPWWSRAGVAAFFPSRNARGESPRRRVNR